MNSVVVLQLQPTMNMTKQRKTFSDGLDSATDGLCQTLGYPDPARTALDSVAQRDPRVGQLRRVILLL